MITDFIPSFVAFPAVSGQQPAHLSWRHLAIKEISRNLPVTFLGLQFQYFSLLCLSAYVLLEEEHTMGQLLVHLLETAVLRDHLLEYFSLHAFQGQRGEQFMIIHDLSFEGTCSFLHQALDQDYRLVGYQFLEDFLPLVPEVQQMRALTFYHRTLPRRRLPVIATSFDGFWFLMAWSILTFTHFKMECREDG